VGNVVGNVVGHGSPWKSSGGRPSKLEYDSPMSRDGERGVPRQVALFFFTFSLAASTPAAGCFLYVSPDDRWSEAYGGAVVDSATDGTDGTALSDVADAEGGGRCFLAPRCSVCCDEAVGLEASNAYFSAAWTCVC